MYHPNLRPLELHKICKKLAHVVFAAEILARIGDDQQPDTKDQKRKEAAQTIQHEREIQAQHRHPVDPRHHDIARENGGQVGQQPDERGQRHSKRDPRTGRTTGGIHQTWKQRAKDR